MAQGGGATAQTASAQSPYSGVTKQYAQNAIEGLQREIERQQVRVQIEYREMWVKAAESSADIFNVYLRQIFGGIGDWEKFSQSIDQAQDAFQMGNLQLGGKRAYEALKQFKDLAQQANGIFDPVTFSEPTNPKSLLEHLQQIRDDTTSLLRNLSSTGFSMVALEEANKRLAELKRQRNEWQTVMANAPSQDVPQPKTTPASPPPPKPVDCFYEVRVPCINKCNELPLVKQVLACVNNCAGCPTK
jgi:hypothetical protein